jgi:hypothetical protein
MDEIAGRQLHHYEATWDVAFLPATGAAAAPIATHPLHHSFHLCLLNDTVPVHIDPLEEPQHGS